MEYRFDASERIASLLDGTPFARDPLRSLVTDICNKLLFLREEGRDVSATIIVSASAEDSAAVLGPVVSELRLVPTPEALTAKLLLKRVGLLSNGGWIPCIEMSGGGPRFLLGFSQASPSNRPVDSVVEAARGRNVLLIERLRPGELTLRYPERGVLRLLANPALVTDAPAVGAIDRFLAALRADRTCPAHFTEWLKHVFRKSLGESHGVLFAVAPASALDDALTAFKAGYVRLTPAIDLVAGELRVGARTPEVVSEAVHARTAALIGALSRMDGVVVFASDLTVCAYSALVDIGAGGEGGARTAALEALKYRHGTKLRGVLFQSQDGAPKFEQFPAS